MSWIFAGQSRVLSSFGCGLSRIESSRILQGFSAKFLTLRTLTRDYTFVQ
jgi:hypothetical protein